MNGGEKPFYTPKSGNGGHGNGYWVRTSTWQIVYPGTGTVGSDTKINQANL